MDNNPLSKENFAASLREAGERYAKNHTHHIHYTYVYQNGWEHGNFTAETSTANPYNHMEEFLDGVGPSIVGVRILHIDTIRVDILYIPEKHNLVE